METDAFRNDAKKGTEIFRELRSGLQSESAAMEALLKAEAGITVSAYQRSLDQVTSLMDKHRIRWEGNEKMLTQIAATESAMRERIYQREMQERSAAAYAGEKHAKGLSAWAGEKEMGGGGPGSLSADGSSSLLDQGIKVIMVAQAFQGLASIVDAFSASVSSANGDFQPAIEALKKLPLGFGSLVSAADSLVDSITRADREFLEKQRKDLNAYMKLAGESDVTIDAMMLDARRRTMSPEDREQFDIQRQYESAVKAAEDRFKAAFQATKDITGDSQLSLQNQANLRYNEELDAAKRQRDSYQEAAQAAKELADAAKSAAETQRLGKQLLDAQQKQRLDAIADPDQRSLSSLRTERFNELQNARLTAEQRKLITDRYAIQEGNLREKIAKTAADREIANAKVVAAERQKLLESYARSQESLSRSLRSQAEGIFNQYASPEQQLQRQIGLMRANNPYANEIADLKRMQDELIRKFDNEPALGARMRIHDEYEKLAGRIRNLEASDRSEDQIAALKQLADLRKQLAGQNNNAAAGGTAQVVSRFMSNVGQQEQKQDKQTKLTEDQLDVLRDILLKLSGANSPLTAE